MGRASLLAVPPNFGPAHAAGSAGIEIKKPSSPRDERTRDTTQIAIPAIFRCCNGRSRKIPHFLLQSGKIRSSRQLPPAAASLHGFPIPSSSSRLLRLVYACPGFLSRGNFWAHEARLAGVRHGSGGKAQSLELRGAVPPSAEVLIVSAGRAAGACDASFRRGLRSEV